MTCPWQAVCIQNLNVAVYATVATFLILGWWYGYNHLRPLRLSTTVGDL